VVLVGLPAAADGRPTFSAATDEIVAALREYAQGREDHLLDVPNHRDKGELVRMIRPCDDDQLCGWLTE
jgi:hypothetical protein